VAVRTVGLLPCAEALPKNRAGNESLECVDVWLQARGTGSRLMLQNGIMTSFESFRSDRVVVDTSQHRPEYAGVSVCKQMKHFVQNNLQSRGCACEQRFLQSAHVPITTWKNLQSLKSSSAAASVSSAVGYHLSVHRPPHRRLLCQRTFPQRQCPPLRPLLRTSDPVFSPC